MKKPRMSAESHALLQQVIAQYQPKSVSDIQEMLKAELDSELGYKKNSLEAKSTRSG